MERITKLTYFIVILGCYGISTSQGSSSNIRTFRQLFSRQANHMLSSIPEKEVRDRRVEECAEACIKETEFRCKSFDYSNDRVSCLLYSVGQDDRDVMLIASQSRDHYQSAYSLLFKKLPGHTITTWVNHRLEGATVEECARRCILETYFKCRGFNYDNDVPLCELTEATAENSLGAIYSQTRDYYEREDRGPLDRFINYGHQAMKPFHTVEVYQKTHMGITLQECAQRCLMESNFECLSFDYIHMGTKSTCHLSKYIAANVYGLAIRDPSVRVNHYEKIEKYLQYFYATPYAVVLGNNLKTFKHVTPNRCARLCMEEAGFVCRSFDYQIEEGTCILSTKTGSDVGGLYNSGGQEVHHFEMKPFLDCGGNLTDDHGNLASPGWPRNYAHHESCTWIIRVQRFKVIHIRFTHFDLGLQSSDPCNEQDDRLVISEPSRGGQTTCVMPNTHELRSLSNEIWLSFITNGEMDGQGFRAFYTAEWTCDANFEEAPGQFASPNWPQPYPSGKRCLWRITAPENQRVKLIFTSFKLEEHPLGHCREDMDHVKVLDGGTITSPKIGLYCNIQHFPPLHSTGRELLVQFVSDEDVALDGFHASFVFESADGTVLTPEEEVMTSGILTLDHDSSKEVGAGKKEKVVEEEEETTNDINSEVTDNTIDLSSDELLDSWGLPEAASSTGEGGGVGDGETRQYKRTMWALLTVLLLVCIVLAVGLFLVWRHYKRKLSNHQELVREDAGVELLPHPVPAPRKNRPSISKPIVKPNNGDLAAEVTLPLSPCQVDMMEEEGGACGGGGAMGGKCLEDDDDDDSACASPATSPTSANNYENNYGKYTKENAKNINLDTKNKLSQFE